MGRKKTELEMNETLEQHADRLRGALFAASLADNFEEAKRICLCAMRGELHGREIKLPSTEFLVMQGRLLPLG